MPGCKTAALTAAIAVAWSGTAWATTEIYAKPGGTLAQQDEALKDCAVKAKTAKAPSDYFNPMAYGATSPAAIIAVSVMAGVMEGVHESREARRFQDRCMRKAGWARISLTFDEDAAYQKASDTQRLFWTNEFLKGDIAGRVQAALTPKAPPLPGAGAETGVGGVLLDPAALVLADGPFGKGQTLLTGKATHRRTATLHEDARIPIPLGMGSMRAVKGTVYHQVELRARAVAADEETSPLWCGKVNAALAGTVDECVWSDFDGYHAATLQPTLISESGYREWLVGTPNFQGKAAMRFDGPFPLDVSDTDLIGPMDFTLKLDKIDKKGVWLAASVSRDGKELPFWKGFAPTDAAGKAVVPLWTHRLTLTVQGDKATGAISADGDGTGLAEVLKAPPKAS